MADFTLCSLPSENGLLLTREEDHLGTVSEQISLDPINKENWENAEEATLQIVSSIHPTVEADFKRKLVIQYIQSLINSSLGFQVIPYGSVPLKTFLPDGDVDLTVIIDSAIYDDCVSDVHAVLRQQEQSSYSPFQVKDVHCIDAEVKLIKCIVQNIVVDISFNQFGGLSTLCFLEEVDRFVGKNHLFKRSIILIKAWCYYESRILGAHHGLISTYALETLVLYIFQLFHSSLNGPLKVLYRFLNYFSKFDWDNYCISLNGPVCKSSLPNIIAEPPENGRGELLLSNEFLRNCVEMFSVPSMNPEVNSRPFPQKHLNIVDPLKENNNLGRSVNRGNYYRIRSAFKYGARKLDRILSLSSDKMINELNKFFANTLDRHGKNHWNHVDSSCLLSSTRISGNSSSSSLSDTSSEDSMLLKSTVGCSVRRPSEVSCWGKFYDASHIGVSGFCGEEGKFENGISNGKTLENLSANGEISCNERSESKENHFVINNSACSCSNHEEKILFGSAISSLVNNISENLTQTVGEGGIYAPRISESLNSLLDLTGDYDSHLRSEVCGQRSHSFAVSASISHPSMFPHSKNKCPWETVCQALQMKRNVYSQMNRNGIFGQQRYPLNHLATFTPASSSEEKRKRQGTGTYIPNTSYHSNTDRPSSGRGKSEVTRANSDLNRHTYDYGLAATLQETSSFDSHELSEAEYPYLGNGKPVLLEVQPSQLSVWGTSSPNGVSCPSEKFDSGGQYLQLQEESLQERKITLDSGTSCTRGLKESPEGKGAEGHEPVLQTEKQRSALESFRLKDDVDFPPLSHGKVIRT